MLVQRKLCRQGELVGYMEPSALWGQLLYRSKPILIKIFNIALHFKDFKIYFYKYVFIDIYRERKGER